MHAIVPVDVAVDLPVVGSGVVDLATVVVNEVRRLARKRST